MPTAKYLASRVLSRAVGRRLCQARVYGKRELGPGVVVESDSFTLRGNLRYQLQIYGDRKRVGKRCDLGLAALQRAIDRPGKRGFPKAEPEGLKRRANSSPEIVQRLAGRFPSYGPVCLRQ